MTRERAVRLRTNKAAGVNGCVSCRGAAGQVQVLGVVGRLVGGKLQVLGGCGNLGTSPVNVAFYSGPRGLR